MKVDVQVETDLTQSARVKKFGAMFDVPMRQKLSHSWQGELPLEQKDWQVGLIVGPSGSGKTTVARHLFGKPLEFLWSAPAVCDDFALVYSIDEIAGICQAVGFNTIPSWLKPFSVLSTGEQFRVTMARALLEGGELVLMDEFTSVVDRQVAQIGAHAVQKYIRRHPGRRFVAVSCHRDILEWLQPDWVLEPADMSFTWRELRRRPALDVEIARVDHSAWRLFAPFHYLTADMHRAATCYCLFVRDQPASFISLLYRPHPRKSNLMGISRAVTLPDYQGLGLVMFLESKVCGAYRALGFDVHGYPAHPPHIRSLDRSPEWQLLVRPGHPTATQRRSNALTKRTVSVGKFGASKCAVFKFVGEALDRQMARNLISGDEQHAATI